jgi:hypothetical protein
MGTTHQVSGVFWAFLKQHGLQAKAQSPTHQVSVVRLRISDNEPPRETRIITLTTRAHRFQKPHPHTNHNPIRPRAPPTKFRPYSCTFQATRPQSPKMPRAPPTKFPLCCYEFQKTNHREKLTSSPWPRRHTVMKSLTHTPKKASLPPDQSQQASLPGSATPEATPNRPEKVSFLEAGSSEATTNRPEKVSLPDSASLEGALRPSPLDPKRPHSLSTDNNNNNNNSSNNNNKHRARREVTLLP